MTLSAFLTPLTLKTPQRNSGMLWEVLGSHSLSSTTQRPFQPLRQSWMNLMLGVVAISTAVGSRDGAC